MENMLIEDKEEDVTQILGVPPQEESAFVAAAAAGAGANATAASPVNSAAVPGAAGRGFGKTSKLDAPLTTDLSDTTESDAEKELTSLGKVPLNDQSQQFYPSPSSKLAEFAKNLVQKIPGVPVEAKCTSPHPGREVMNTVVPIHIDQLFTLLFTSSKFFLDFHASRKTTDLSQSPWAQTSANVKSRIVSSTVALNQSVGPKSAQVTETQVMLPCSKPGSLYAIDVDTVNAGIPYADSFNIYVHYCLSYVSEHQSRICVFAEIRYKKSVWGLVKGMIEKNCWQGLDDFYTSLGKALENEADTVITPTGIKRKSRKRKRHLPYPRDPHHLDMNRAGSVCPTTAEACAGNPNSSFQIVLIVVLLALLFLNVNLYYKLWSLEESPPYTVLDLHVLKETPKSHDEWVILLQQQETLHTVEIQKWQRGLKRALTLLKQTEAALLELSTSIHPTYTEKVISVLQNNKEAVNSIHKMNEDADHRAKVPHHSVKPAAGKETEGSGRGNVQPGRPPAARANQHSHSDHDHREPIEVIP